VIERLRLLLADALRPVKRRHKTRPSNASRERRLDAKKARGRLKRERSSRDDN
jgi:ribosome-associated protein